MIWLTLGGGLAVSVLSGAALGAALGLTGFAVLHFFGGGSAQRGMEAVWNVLNSFTLTSVPLFILLGDVLVASGLSKGVYHAMAPLFARVPGKLLHTNIAVCTVFGAVSGSSMSVAAAVGSVAYPELKARGYERGIVVGTLAAGGTLGLLIPPSLSLLIYGALTDTSIGKLFIAGVFPGLMMAALFMGWVLIAATRDARLVPTDDAAPSLGAALAGLVEIWPLVAMIVAVLGSLFAGLATPTEAAAVGVAAAIVLGVTKGELTARKLGEALVNTTRTFGIIGTVFIGAVILAQSIQLLGLPQQMLQGISQLGISKYLMLGVIVAIYLVLGCFFDGLSMMIMTLPIVFPLMTGLGFDAVWLGVVVTIMIEIGMLTPPVGMNLFVLVGITKGEVPLGEAARAATPFWIAMLLGVAILTLFPGIATWLPQFIR
jgi:tripartite ATP-independent transporter DctM subunit